MKLMKQHTAEPAVDTSREEHEADLAGFHLPEFLTNTGPALPPVRVSYKLSSYASETPSQLSNGLILHVSVSMDSRVSLKY